MFKFFQNLFKYFQNLFACCKGKCSDKCKGKCSDKCTNRPKIIHAKVGLSIIFFLEKWLDRK